MTHRVTAPASRPRVRILHLVIDLEVGGLERVVVNHLRFADRRRFDVGVLCLGHEGRLAYEARRLGVSVQALGQHGNGIANTMKSLVSSLRRLKPDVLHTHDFPPHLLGSPAARLARIPVVIHTRHCRTGGLTVRQTLALRIASAMSDVIVAVSEDAALLLSSERVSCSKSLVIRNGIDLEQFTPDERWRRRPGRRAISVGRLTEVKDYPTLLRAAQKVARKLPGFRLDIVGEGPMRQSLEALMSELELEACVSFLGQRVDVAALLASADVFALSSTSEGLSISILEAIASGLPVVATRVGGNAEIVDDTVGILVPPGNADALADGLVALLSDHARLAAMGRSARIRAETHFDLRRVVRRYETVYLERLAAAGYLVVGATMEG